MADQLPPTLRRYVDHMDQIADASDLAELALPPKRDAVVDGGGHHRPAYLGLLAWVRGRLGVPAAHLLHESDEAWPDTMPNAADAERLTRLAWDELALSFAHGDADRSRSLFERVAEQGARFVDDGSNPEPRWYAELVLLHALTSYAAWAEREDLLHAAADAAAYHQAETQPDHATGQPWAIQAALLRPDTLPLADLLLLPVSLPDGRSTINRLLLADAAMTIRSPAFLAASTWQ